MSTATTIVETASLAKHFRRAPALDALTLALPAGHVVALVGPNGAGKTTFLHCLVGLCTPDAGTIRVLGGLRPGSPEALDRVAFVAQDAPLYRSLSVRTTLEVAEALNRDFDRAEAEARLDALAIPLTRKVGKLSGGQQAQLALTLALARHPTLLVLDEPFARLDPLARHDLMGVVMRSVAVEGTSVVLSSHAVSELERVADYLVLLSRGRAQLAGSIEELLAAHALLEGPAEETDEVARQLAVVGSTVAGRQALLLVQVSEARRPPPGWLVHEPTLEELVLAYLRDPSAFLARPRSLGPSGVRPEGGGPAPEGVLGGGVGAPR